MSNLDNPERVSVIDHLIYEKPCSPIGAGVAPSILAAIRAAGTSNTGDAGSGPASAGGFVVPAAAGYRPPGYTTPADPEEGR